jgi:regulator of sigma E protease
MTILAGLGNSIYASLSYILPFIFVLSVVVFFHELGHFLVARWCRVKVETFSIGFGSELVGWNDRHGTRWKIAWLPLGGYVKFLGDENVASANTGRFTATTAEERTHSFPARPLYQRMAIIAAGPMANFLLSIVIFAGLFATFGEVIVPARVDTVVAGSPAAQAGFQKGDRVVAVDGRAIRDFAALQEIVSQSAGRPLAVTVERGGRDGVLHATPRVAEMKDPFGGERRAGMLGIAREAGAAGDVIRVRHGPVESVWLGVRETYRVVARSLEYVGRMVAGQETADQLGGPLRIAEMSGKVAQAGFGALINLAAILSTSIGLINLFPVPMLDGGHLLYGTIEAVRGRPLGERAQEFGYRVGFTLVVALMAFATWNDLIHLRVVQFVAGLFS